MMIDPLTALRRVQATIDFLDGIHPRDIGDYVDAINEIEATLQAAGIESSVSSEDA